MPFDCSSMVSVYELSVLLECPFRGLLARESKILLGLFSLHPSKSLGWQTAGAGFLLGCHEAHYGGWGIKEITGYYNELLLLG